MGLVSPKSYGDKFRPHHQGSTPGSTSTYTSFTPRKQSNHQPPPLQVYFNSHQWTNTSDQGSYLTPLVMASTQSRVNHVINNLRDTVAATKTSMLVTITKRIAKMKITYQKVRWAYNCSMASGFPCLDWPSLIPIAQACSSTSVTCHPKFNLSLVLVKKRLRRKRHIRQKIFWSKGNLFPRLL